MKTAARAAIAFFLTLSACRTVPARLDHIPLVWKPTSSIQLPPETLNGILDASLQVDTFKDVRRQPELIAENRENAAPRPVTTGDNVGAYTTTHLRDIFDRMGLKTVESDGDVVIGGEVRQFFVDETTTYKGHVLLRVIVRNRAGKTLWSGGATGAATRFGHSFSAENYYEVLADSLINAAASLVQNPEFQAAVAKEKK